MEYDTRWSGDPLLIRQEKKIYFMIVSTFQSQENQLVSQHLPLDVVLVFILVIIKWWPGDECLRAWKREGGKRNSQPTLFLCSLFFCCKDSAGRWHDFHYHQAAVCHSVHGGGEKGKGIDSFRSSSIRLRAAARTRTVTHNKHALRHDGIIFVVNLQCRFFFSLLLNTSSQRFKFTSKSNVIYFCLPLSCATSCLVGVLAPICVCLCSPRVLSGKMVG